VPEMAVIRQKSHIQALVPVMTTTYLSDKLFTASLCLSSPWHSYVFSTGSKTHGATSPSPPPVSLEFFVSVSSCCSLHTLTFSLPDRENITPPKTANTASNVISYITVISIAYLASPDLSGTLGIIIYFLRRKYPACKAAKGLM